MPDIRLHAGRHHLHNGSRALDLGHVEAGRAHFETALLQFAGPELRLGEAHALRGLARVELQVDGPDAAIARARKALLAYQELEELLDREDPEAVAEVRLEARRGEAACQVVLGEAYQRAGRGQGARRAFQEALRLLEGVPTDATTATVWCAVGRLALSEGRTSDGQSALERAARIYWTRGDQSSLAVTRLLLAQVHQLRGELDRAREELTDALRTARKDDNLLLEARVLCALGALALRAGRPAEARSYYEDTIPFARITGDLVREGVALIGLGTALSRAGEAEAGPRLLEGARLLAGLEHHPGLASALQHVGMHARSQGAPLVALAAAQGARRFYRLCDPVRGVGQALRVIVKALVELGEDRAALDAAELRLAVVGRSQPNAVHVRDWLRERLALPPGPIHRDLDVDGLRAHVDRHVRRLLFGPLDACGFDLDACGDETRCLDALEALQAAHDVAPTGPAVVLVRDPTEQPAPARRPAPPRAPESAGPRRSLDDIYGQLWDSSTPAAYSQPSAPGPPYAEMSQTDVSGSAHSGSPASTSGEDEDSERSQAEGSSPETPT